MKNLHLAFILSFFMIISGYGILAAQHYNGFDLSRLTINRSEVFHGGPPRDGIPSIDNPRFLPANNVNYLKDDDIVIGLVRGKVARAYPTRILVWHEIVNDTIEGEHVAVTYCPLCGTAMVFSRKIGGQIATFGVSGLLYRSDVLMYDRESESLWSQLAMKAVSGPNVGKQLRWLPSHHLTWKAWKKKHPTTEVLSTETGYSRNYGGQAYASYFASGNTMFPVPHERKELPNKEWVLGVILDGKAKAYPVSQLPSQKEVQDTIGNTSVTVLYDAERKHPQIKLADGSLAPTVMVFWFAWQAFYPETALWSP